MALPAFEFTGTSCPPFSSSTAIRPNPKHLCADTKGLCTSAMAPRTRHLMPLSPNPSKVPVPSLGTNSPDAVLNITSLAPVTVTLSFTQSFGTAVCAAPVSKLNFTHSSSTTAETAAGVHTFPSIAPTSKSPTSASGAGSAPASADSPFSNPETCFLPLLLPFWFPLP